MSYTDLDPELFIIREQDGLRLIIPSHNAGVANAPWTRDTVLYRSRVETLDGTAVSQGFAKFFNIGQGPLDLQVTAQDVADACKEGTAVATLKLDGSLLIRSVYEGKVFLRTRGSFSYEHLDNAAEMQLFREKYPLVFDPDWFENGVSLLFEWTSPQNVIVLKYPEPELTLVGGVDHKTLQYLRILSLRSVAELLQVPLVKHFRLTPEGWDDLQRTLDTKDIEGYVIRLHDEQRLVKVKALPYLTKHALKSTLTSEKLADMYFQQARPSYGEFCAEFSSALDEETLLWAIPAISSMYDGVRELLGIEARMRSKAVERREMSRKQAALLGLAEYGQTKRFSMYMQLWEGREVETKLLKSILLQNTKQVELSMFTKPEAVE